MSTLKSLLDERSDKIDKRISSNEVYERESTASKKWTRGALYAIILSGAGLAYGAYYLCENCSELFKGP